MRLKTKKAFSNVAIALLVGCILLVSLWVGFLPYYWLWKNVKAIRVEVEEINTNIKENLM